MVNVHKLIFFEGPSGVGKSTLSELTKDYLINKGLRAQKIKYPTPYLRELIQSERYNEKRDPILEAYLFASDFRNLLFREILPIKEDTIFIFDRSYVTSCADSNYGENEIKTILEINKHNPRPDLLFILNCLPQTAIQRIKQRELETGKPISKRETLDYITELMERYKLIPENFENTELVNVEQPLDRVLLNITKKIGELFKI